MPRRNVGRNGTGACTGHRRRNDRWPVDRGGRGGGFADPTAGAPSAGRAIDHLAFEVADLDTAAPGLRDRGVRFTSDPERPAGGRSEAKRGFVSAPDNVRVAVIEPGWQGVDADFGSDAAEVASAEPYVVPRTPWGTPDL